MCGTPGSHNIPVYQPLLASVPHDSTTAIINFPRVCLHAILFLFFCYLVFLFPFWVQVNAVFAGRYFFVLKTYMSESLPSSHFKDDTSAHMFCCLVESDIRNGILGYWKWYQWILEMVPIHV